MIWLPVMDLPAQCPVLADCGVLTAMMLTPGTTVTLPLLGRLVIVTEVASGLQFASQERSSTSGNSTPEAAGRVSLISWASVLAPMSKGASNAIAGMNVRMALPADIWTMAIPLVSRSSIGGREQAAVTRSASQRLFDPVRQRAGPFEGAVVVVPLDAAAIR